MLLPCCDIPLTALALSSIEPIPFRSTTNTISRECGSVAIAARLGRGPRINQWNPDQAGQPTKPDVQTWRTLPGIPNRDYALPEIPDRPFSGAAVSRPRGDDAGVHPSKGTKFWEDRPSALLGSICNRKSARRSRLMARRHSHTDGIQFTHDTGLFCGHASLLYGGESNSHPQYRRHAPCRSSYAQGARSSVPPH